MSIINMTCGEIQSSVGFVFVILPVILNQTLNDPDCEQSWYTEDGHLLADPSDPHKLMYPVTSVSSDRLVTSDCVDELHHEIQCHSKRITHETVFRVRNETAATPNSDVLDEVTPSLQLSDHLWWISVLVIIFLLAFLCFMLRKRIFRGKRGSPVSMRMIQGTGI
ncbi:uncharacterized protein LOC125247987 isoform X3 [Megalobrama amblycephala]|uniref:uncharacterized protein LOC125247987 isoform X3 n=1 Tax=Megalobrama amblycephala TaxID=75352 RepID=UPI002014755B|nr:uncharacterized protein LOC125247987 isoform X3 [Megalobrama amblycephala]